MTHTYGPTLTRLRVQYGLKFAVAGVLTMFCECWLRLDSLRWGLSTVIVLMVVQYVGAIVEKAFFRLLGTVAGALLGVALVGNFVGNGPLFLTLVFICIAVLGYMANGKWAPYAFMLCAYTLLIVASGTIFTPQDAWKVGLSRALSIITGIIVTVLVSTLLWPRHARWEFRYLVATMLDRIGDAMKQIEKFHFSHTSSRIETAEIDAAHLKDIELLQKLLLFGARESAAFALRVPSYRILVDRLNRLHSVFMSVAQTQVSSDLLSGQIQKTLNELITAIEEECTFFRQSLINGSIPQSGNLESASEAFRDCLEILGKKNPLPKDQTVEVAEFARLATGFLDAVVHLHAIRQQLVCLFGPRRYRPPFLEKGPPVFKFDVQYAISGFKGALVGVLGLIYCDWIHPPGFDIIPSSAWLFIMLPGTYFHGNKNQKTMHHTFWIGLIGIPALTLFTFLTPWIANYFYANIFLFVSFFLLGIAYFEDVGVFSQVYFALTIAIGTMINYCQHWPIQGTEFQDLYFGILLALTLCALVQRLLWPPLPQKEFFKACQRYFSGCLNAVNAPFAKPASMAPATSEIFQTAWDTARWLPFLPLRACRPQERKHLDQLLSQMRSAGYQLTVLRSTSKHPETEAFLKQILPLLTPLKEAFSLDLQDCYQAFASRQPPSLPSPERPSPKESFRSLYQVLREKKLLQAESTRVRLEVFGILCHFEAAACAIRSCRQIVAGLQLENYAGDVAM